MARVDPKTLRTAFNIFKSQCEFRRQQERMAADIATMLGQPGPAATNEILCAMEDDTRNVHSAWTLLMQCLGFYAPVSAETETTEDGRTEDGGRRGEEKPCDSNLLELLRSRRGGLLPPRSSNSPNHPR